MILQHQRVTIVCNEPWATAKNESLPRTLVHGTWRRTRSNEELNTIEQAMWTNTYELFVKQYYEIAAARIVLQSIADNHSVVVQDVLRTIHPLVTSLARGMGKKRTYYSTGGRSRLQHELQIDHSQESVQEDRCF